MEIIILIPVYKSILEGEELRAFKQIIGTFDRHHIALFGPENLVLPEILKNIKYYPFPASNFKSVEQYSNLLLSPNFYKTFLAFKYLLICQLDVWVFKDELEFWIKKGYDYVGAPWLSAPPLTKGKPLFNLQPYFVNRVGNGGFSLRKVRVHYNVTKLFKPLLYRFKKNEDMFWGLFIDLLWPFFKKPSAEEALHFCVEMDGPLALEKLQGKLPMAVHAYEKYDKDFWIKLNIPFDEKLD